MTERGADQIAAHVRIYGRVQGVWFRAWTAKTASTLEVTGWVRNRSDGSVEALFVGPSSAVETMIARCHEGPPAARVDDVVREPASGTLLTDLDGVDFRQLPSL